MKYHLVILVLISQLGFAKSLNTKEAANYLKSLISKKSSNEVKLKGCKYNKEKWLALILSKTPFKEKITFNKSCYIQGEYTAQMEKFFPIDLKLKNKNFDRAQFQMKISIFFKESMILRLDIKNGKLFKGKENISFTATKSFSVDPLNPKKVLSDYKKGSLTLSQNGKNKQTLSI